MLALNLSQCVAQRGKEVLIGSPDRTIEIELDDRLCLRDRRQLARAVGRSKLLGGDVGCILHHFEGLSIRVGDGIIGSLYPDLLSAIANASVFARIVFATAEFRPKLPVSRTRAIALVDEHRVMLAPHVTERVSERLEEIVVRSQDTARKIELDNRLGFRDRRELAGAIGRGELLRGDVGRILDDFERLSVHVENRIVGCLNPDLPATLSDPLEFGRFELSPSQLRPEITVGLAGAVRGLDEHRVRAALNLVERIAGRRKKIGVRCDDGAVEFEFNDRLGFRDRRELAGRVGGIELPGRDVRRVLHHFDDVAGIVQHWIVGGLDPDFAPALRQPLKLSRLEFAMPQLGPKLPVIHARTIARIDEDSMVFASDLVHGVPHHCEEVVVGVEDIPIRVELDDGLRAP